MQSPADTQSACMTERRRARKPQANPWQRLNLVQQYAVNSLIRFGYELLFVRNCDSPDSLAVACHDGQLATIDAEGEVDYTPNIILRTC